MIRDDEQVIWAHIEAVKDSERNIGWSVTRVPNEAVYLNNFSKMRIPLMEKVFNSVVVAELRRAGFLQTGSTCSTVQTCGS